MRCSIKDRCSGMSLVELIVATGVLVFTLTALISFFINTVRLNEESRNLSLATSHAQTVLEDIRNANYAGIDTLIYNGYWNWSPTMLTYKGLGTLNNETITATVSGAGPFTVDVAVGWNDTQQRVRSTALATLLGGG